MSTTTDNSPEPPHDRLAQLLAKAGPRSAPPAALQAEVRAAVHAEWRHLLQSRAQQQQRRWLAAAAMLLVAVGAGWLTLRTDTAVDAPASAPLLATVTQGRPLLNGAPVQEVRSGDVLTTQTDGARVQLRNGIVVRIDRGTELRWLNDAELQLQQGAIYVDSHDNAAALTIHTAHGDVRHLGTRYLVDAEPQQLQVAVREGRVAVRTQTQELSLDALQQVLLDAGGAARRGDLNMNDELWHWADALAQPFALENRSVAEFLQWVSTETGYELNYASGAVQQAAAQTLLHGGATNQAPLQALQTVLAATDFRVSMQGRRLLVAQSH